MKKYFGFIIAVVVIVGSISSCKKENNLDDLRNEELRLLEDYIAEYHPDAEPTSSGLYYIETEKGTGDTIKGGDQVQIWYTGRLLKTGDVFDTTDSDEEGHSYEPLKFTVGLKEVITGLDEGISFMRRGGKATLIIPSNLGYGATNEFDRGIPRFSTLIFDIEVYKHIRFEDR